MALEVSETGRTMTQRLPVCALAACPAPLQALRTVAWVLGWQALSRGSTLGVRPRLRSELTPNCFPLTWMGVYIWMASLGFVR